MPKVNPDDYVEIFEDTSEDDYDVAEYLMDTDYKKFEKIKPKKHHFKENRNIDRLIDKQKDYRNPRIDKKI